MSPRIATSWRGVPKEAERNEFLKDARERLREPLLQHAQALVGDWAKADQLCRSAFAHLERNLAAGKRIDDAELWLKKAVALLAERERVRSDAPRRTGAASVAETTDDVMDAAFRKQERIRDLETRLQITAVRSGTRQEYEAHFSEYVLLKQDRLLQQAHGITRCYHAAQDVVQQAFVKLHGQLTEGKFRERTDANVSGWLARVVTTGAVDHLRARRNGATSSRAMDSLPAPEQACPLESAEAIARTWQQVETLPPQLQRVVMLRLAEEWDYVKIARFMEISPETARRHYYKAMSALTGD